MPLTDHSHADDRGHSLREAAGVLGISPHALRMRIKRGSIEAYKDTDGRWYVLLPDGDREPSREPSHGYERGDDRGTSRGEAYEHSRIARLESEVAFLRAELEARRESERELRILLAEQGRTLAEIARSMPVLPVGTPERPPDSPESPQSTPEWPPEPQGVTQMYRIPEPAKRPWWQFWRRP